MTVGVDQALGIASQMPGYGAGGPGYGYDPVPPVGPIVPTDGRRVRVTAPNYDEEYVAGSPSYGYPAPERVLQRVFDQVEKLRGPWAHDIIATDPKVASCLRVLKQGVVANGITIEPRVCAVPGDDDVDPVKQAAIDEAKEAHDFVMEGVNQMPRKLIAWAYEMLDHTRYGHKLSEVLYEPPREDPADRWYGKSPLKVLKVKRRRSYRFVIDPYWNLVGVLGATTDPAEPVVLPMSKFALLTNDSREGDPRGVSACTEVDAPWFHKVTAMPEHAEYLKQHASAKMWGELPPEVGFDTSDNPVTGQYDPNAMPVPPARSFNQRLQQFRNGTTMVVANGARVNAIPPQGDGTPFLKTYEWSDNQIASGILGASRAVQEAKHSSKADGEIAQDVSGLVILWNKILLRLTIESVFWYNLAFNFGVEYATRNCPKALLGETEHQDFASVAAAVASAFTAGYLAPNQLPYTDNKLGLPPGQRSDDQIARLSAPGRQAPTPPPGGVENSPPESGAADIPPGKGG